MRAFKFILLVLYNVYSTVFCSIFQYLLVFSTVFCSMFSIYLYIPLYFAVYFSSWKCSFHLRSVLLHVSWILRTRKKSVHLDLFGPFQAKIDFLLKSTSANEHSHLYCIFLFLTMLFSPPVPLHVSWIQRARKQISRTVFQSRNQKYILTEYMWWWVAQRNTSDIPQRTSVAYIPNYYCN